MSPRKIIGLSLLLIISITWYLERAVPAVAIDRIDPEPEGTVAGHQESTLIKHNPNNKGDNADYKDYREYLARQEKHPAPNFKKLGFTSEGAKIMAEGNPKKTVKIADYSDPAERERLTKALEIRNKLKYLDLPETQADDLYFTIDRMYSGEPDQNELSFKPTEIPEWLDDYDYIGYADDSNKDFYPEGYKRPMVRKVYQRNDGQLLIIDEETLKDGADIAIEEFVNKRIKDYPAHLFVLKSPKTKRQAAYLKVSTNKSQYILYIIGRNIENESSKETLVKIAERIIN